MGKAQPHQMVPHTFVSLLYNFIQFSGYASHTHAAMNFGLGHGSWHPVLNVKCVTLGPNLPWRCKKSRIFEIFVLNAEFLEVSRQNLLVAEVPNRYFESQVTTRAKLNELLQYN
jgi:hypothetical protein